MIGEHNRLTPANCSQTTSEQLARSISSTYLVRLALLNWRGWGGWVNSGGIFGCTGPLLPERCAGVRIGGGGAWNEGGDVGEGVDRGLGQQRATGLGQKWGKTVGGGSLAARRRYGLDDVQGWGLGWRGRAVNFYKTPFTPASKTIHTSISLQDSLWIAYLETSELKGSTRT